MKCNDFCDHCYNNSGPHGETLETEELLRVIPNLPDSIGRIIISGGEPTVELDKVVDVVSGLKERYGSDQQVWLQSNGDLINERRLTRLLATGLNRIDIVSVDRYHRQQGAHVGRLKELFAQHGMIDAKQPGLDKEQLQNQHSYAFWGATEDLWLKGNWARGRANDNDLARMDPNHNVCSLWSGARGFLEHGTDAQEVHIQLYRLYPCCPTTYFSLGDVREERVEDILKGIQNESVYTTLNQGKVYMLGLESGLTGAFIRERIESLGNVCLWCDEFFEQYYAGRRGEARIKASEPLTRIGSKKRVKGVI